jgi:hypothetical protein
MKMNENGQEMQVQGHKLALKIVWKSHGQERAFQNAPIP